jgi:catechol 2,3-dioxygenase-like lactoylglutathione lyase family enzyme
MRSVLTVLTATCLLAATGSAHAQTAPPNQMGVAYGHVHLNVKDIEQHKKLWVDHFGGTVVQKGPLTVLKFQKMMIVLTKAEAKASNETTVIDHFGFHVRDTADVVQKWRAAGFEVIREFTGPEGTKNAFLRGPDLLKFEVQENKDLQALAVPNHVHFLSPDNANLMNWYVERFGLAPRARGTLATTADAPAGFNVSFSKSQMALAPTKGSSVDHIGFEVKDLESFVKKLEAGGVKFDVPYRKIPAIELAIAFFTDPSGVYVELTEGLDKY